MLDVVVERAVDVLQAPAGQRDERQPVIVELHPGAFRERQRALHHVTPDEHRGAGHRVGDQHRGHVRAIVEAPDPHRVAQALPAGAGQPLIGVHERARADARSQRRELVRVPDVVLVAQRDQLGLRRGERERPLEVAIEAEPLRRLRDVEAWVVAPAAEGIGGARGLGAGGGGTAGAVVGDHARPVGVGLRTDRFDLRAQQLRIGPVGGHADCDRAGGQRPGLMHRLHRDPRELGAFAEAVAAARLRLDDDLGRRARDTDGDRRPEPATSLGDVEARHPERGDVVGLTVNEQRQGAHRTVPVHRDAREVHLARAAGLKRRRQWALEPDPGRLGGAGRSSPDDGRA